LDRRFIVRMIWQINLRRCANLENESTLAVSLGDLRDFTAYAATVGDQQAFRVARLFTDLVTAAVSEHDGRLIKTYGDGAMSAFPNVTQAAVVD